eukprot:jgi/Galph1/1020/GphlegSOOS_G5806.1
MSLYQPSSRTRDLAQDTVASSLLKNLKTNQVGNNKQASNNNSRPTQTTSSSKEDLWDYSDIFGKEWSQGLGTAHQALANTSGSSSKEKEKPENEQKDRNNNAAASFADRKTTKYVMSSTNKNKPIRKRVISKTVPDANTHQLERSRKNTFKEELERWQRETDSRQKLKIDEKSSRSQSKYSRNCKLGKPIKVQNNMEDDVFDDDDEDKEVYTFEDLMEEEERSAKIAAKEDAEEYHKEKERKLRKKLKRLAANEKKK